MLTCFQLTWSIIDLSCTWWPLGHHVPLGSIIFSCLLKTSKTYALLYAFIMHIFFATLSCLHYLSRYRGMDSILLHYSKSTINYTLLSNNVIKTIELLDILLFRATISQQVNIKCYWLALDQSKRALQSHHIIIHYI